MSETTSYIEDVGQLIKEMKSIGFTPVLVGGMALVILGSRRVTKDFDFLVSEEAREQKELLNILYSKGFELASRINKQGDIVTTIKNQNVARSRLKIDRPASAYFLNPSTGLRIDFLFDFPLPASELLLNAQKRKIRSYIFHIASREDLVRLKKIACKDRALAADIQDLKFLQSE